MGQAIGQTLSFSIGIVLSPMAIVAATVALSGDRTCAGSVVTGWRIAYRGFTGGHIPAPYGSHSSARALPVSATKTLPAELTATPLGSESCPEPEPAEPKAAMKLPAELNSCTRSLPTSET